MNRKHNPWLALVALLLAVVLVMTCAGCSSTTATAETPTRFIIERGSIDPFLAAELHIITDTETGVQYLMYAYRNGAGLTRLEG